MNSTNQQGDKLVRQRSEDSREAEPEDSPTNKKGAFAKPTLLIRFVVLVFGLAAVSNAQEPAEEYRNAVAGVEADLAAELQKLAELREQIAAEKPALAKETNEIAAGFREKTRRAKLADLERESLVHDLSTLSDRVKKWRDENHYIIGLLDEFDKQHEANISLAELTDADSELDTAEQALARLAVPQRVISGQALTDEGTAVSGTFLGVGPISWFVADDNSRGGLVAGSAGLQPEIVSDTTNPSAIRKLVENQSATVTFDPTLGTVVALGETKTSLQDHIKKGGFWIYPILLLGLIATIAAIAKWIQLSRIREVRPAVVQRILKNPDGAEKELVGVRHPAREILARGIELRDQPREDVEEALYEKYLAAQPPLQKGLALIAIASATAPLLGLLGTVTGMIHTFDLIDIFGTGDAKSLASGISEALITTKFGLIVAIPALIIHALMRRKVQGIKATMEMISLAFLNGLKGGKTL
ncbi:MAG: MotA/TolQ/ExbB proton channel family protein [Verrucomicrobiales bacterium]